MFVSLFSYFNEITCFVSLDFKLPALFLCITFFLDNLSIRDITSGNNFLASFFEVILLSFLIAFLVVLC